MAGDSRIGNAPRTGEKSPLSDTIETPATAGVSAYRGLVQVCAMGEDFYPIFYPDARAGMI